MGTRVRPDAPDTHVLELRGIRKSYGAHMAVEGVDIALRPEEFMTFLGPSGSGKTTTLMMVAGLQKPDAGDIILAGRSVAAVPAHRRDIGMVFQHYALFPHMSVQRNVAFPLEMRRVPQHEIDRKVADILSVVGLGNHGVRMPRQMSGGQQQRVALARALVYGPSLLLMDEPLGALDKKLREQLQREIKRVHRERRTSVLYVTHDQEEALTMSDRIAVFNHGRIEQVGSPSELYEHPATRFVADFVGEMNFLPADVIGSEGGRVQVMVAGAPMVAMTGPDAVAPGARVVVAVRPERLVIEPAAPTGGLTARVEDVIYLGNARRSVLRLSDGTECVALQGAEVADRNPAVPGETTRLSWQQTYATVFLPG